MGYRYPLVAGAEDGPGKPEIVSIHHAYKVRENGDCHYLRGFDEETTQRIIRGPSPRLPSTHPRLIASFDPTVAPGRSSYPVRDESRLEPRVRRHRSAPLPQSGAPQKGAPEVAERRTRRLWRGELPLLQVLGDGALLGSGRGG